MDGYAKTAGAKASVFSATGRAVMQKKFKISDGSKTFVEKNTLLEPANNAAALQHDQEEINEVSIQLSQIKKKHDEAKKQFTAKKGELEKIKKEIEQIELQEANAEPSMFKNKTRLQELGEFKKETEAKINEERMSKRTYMHMLERMKKDFIATKIKANDFEKNLVNKKSVIEIEEGKQRKTKEERLQSKNTFDKLMKNIEKEQEDRRSRILELQKCIANKEESVKRRIDRQKRNQEIAESAANESQDQDANKMRSYLYINKLWNNFMRIKMKEKMADNEDIDEAFKKIKTHTAVTDVQTMVRRFQQKEQTYTALLQTVSTSE